MFLNHSFAPSTLNKFNLIEFSIIKSGKHGTSTPEFGPKPGEIEKKPAKKYISLVGGGGEGQTQKCTTFCAKLSIIRF